MPYLDWECKHLLEGVESLQEVAVGMAEKFGELTAKNFEKWTWICQIIVDDLYIGGSTQEEAALNYAHILAIFKKSDAAKGGKKGMNSAGISHVLYAVKQ